MKTSNQHKAQAEGLAIIFAILIVCILIAGGMFALPKYNVWSSGMAGEAELAQASYNRQIQVQEAKAKKESATMLASAEIERAKGVAEANRIIGHSLEGNDAYLRYLWIDTMKNGEKDVVYVPTEAGLPILESTRNLQKYSPPEPPKK